MRMALTWPRREAAWVLAGGSAAGLAVALLAGEGAAGWVAGVWNGYVLPAFVNSLATFGLC